MYLVLFWCEVFSTTRTQFFSTHILVLNSLKQIPALTCRTYLLMLRKFLFRNITDAFDAVLATTIMFAFVLDSNGLSTFTATAELTLLPMLFVVFLEEVLPTAAAILCFCTSATSPFKVL